MTFLAISGRRRKAAPDSNHAPWGRHHSPSNLVSWGSWVVMGLTMILSTHALRVLFARPYAARVAPAQHSGFGGNLSERH